jgi:CRISPR-associated protein Cmr6
MAKRKKKKNKQPAVKRNRGTLLDLNMQDIKNTDTNIECKESIQNRLKISTPNDIKQLYEQNKNIPNINKEKVEKLDIRNKLLDNDLLSIVLTENGKKKIDKIEVEYIKKIYAIPFIPNNTKNIIDLLIKNEVETDNIAISNLHLKLNKFAFIEIKNEDKISFTYKEKYCLDISEHTNTINKYYLSLKDYIKEENKKYDFSLKISNRLIVGLGSVSVYETSITLHHIYGIPYIPASAIKGVLRSYMILECFSKELEKYGEDKYQKFEEEVLFAKDEDSNYKNKEFIDIFGSQKQEGKVIFFDAFPISNPILKVDIMNPHYGHYYNDGEAPTDTKNPIPINFLTVEDTKFRFIIGSKKEEIKNFKFKNKNIEEWLKEALTNHGIGAKTAVGYGYFK